MQVGPASQLENPVLGQSISHPGYTLGVYYPACTRAGGEVPGGAASFQAQGT